MHLLHNHHKANVPLMCNSFNRESKGRLPGPNFGSDPCASAFSLLSSHATLWGGGRIDWGAMCSGYRGDWMPNKHLHKASEGEAEIQVLMEIHSQINKLSIYCKVPYIRMYKHISVT